MMFDSRKYEPNPIGTHDVHWTSCSRDIEMGVFWAVFGGFWANGPTRRYELSVVDHRNAGIVIPKKINHRNPRYRPREVASFHEGWITADSVDKSR